jgi:hypothetical protein
MTAPANDALLITLLAVFTACAGYAAGRLHQWYRTGLDRDEAYRDGYDTATRSVFSMAARLIGPRRAVRGTAVVTSATVTPAVITTAPVTAGTGDRLPIGDGLNGEVALSAADLPTTRLSSAVSVRPSSAAASGRADRSSPVAAAQGQADRRSSAAASGRGDRSSPVAAQSQTDRPSSAAVPAQADRSSSSAVPAQADRPSSVAVPVSAEEPAGAPADRSSPAADLPAGVLTQVAAEDHASPADGSGGRHLVPDELVQAPTYRLPPDRVARAKVRQAPAADDKEQETTRLPSVPRPRSS